MQYQTGNKFFFVLIILLSAFTINSQSIVEDLGGIKSNFIISSNNEPMEVTGQVIFEKKIPIHEHRLISERHLQWISPQRLTVNKERARFRKYIKIELFDKEGNLLYSYEKDKRRSVTRPPWLGIIPPLREKESISFYIYSLNIDEIPLILLDMTHSINIERHHTSLAFEQ